MHSKISKFVKLNESSMPGSSLKMELAETEIESHVVTDVLILGGVFNVSSSELIRKHKQLMRKEKKKIKEEKYG
ncbi:hypothetical protein QVD17_32015 [Tagetes erecta]|uniref:Uncharacterized protein n=1 Tax=Tagetes erecta TaxID=13708 RepID=A0AAD8K797_TARER|nr:hypothetical protein QVD17_32015 [Tagetes erecta]